MKKIISLILCVMMVASMLPVSALADEETITAETAAEDVSVLLETALEEIEAEESEGPEETEVPEETTMPEVTESPSETDEEVTAVETEQESETLLATSGTCGDNLTWTLSDDGVLTISGEGAMTDFACDDDSSFPPWPSIEITSLVIESGVTTIGKNAFSLCGLKSVTIPDTVTVIGESAFSYCCNLTSITIPDSVTTIGVSAFYNNTALESVTICDGVTTIGAGAFYNCYNLINVVIGNNVTIIGDAAFYDCYDLTSLVIGASVTTIGAEAFSACGELTSVNIPDSVTTIGEMAFWRCVDLKDVYYSGSEEQWNLINIGSNCFGATNATIHYNSSGDSDGNDSGGLILESSYPANGGVYEDDGYFGGVNLFFNKVLSEELNWENGACIQICRNLTDEVILEINEENAEEYITVEPGVVSGAVYIDTPEELDYGPGIYYIAISPDIVTTADGSESFAGLEKGDLVYIVDPIDNIEFNVANSILTLSFTLTGEYSRGSGNMIIEDSGGYEVVQICSTTLDSNDVFSVEYNNNQGVTEFYLRFDLSQYILPAASSMYLVFESDCIAGADDIISAEGALSREQLSWKTSLDTWSFSNSSEYYGNTSNGYEITESDYNRLIKNLFPTEIKEIDARISSTWGGSCYGMSAWVSLASSGEKQAIDVAGNSALSLYECTEQVESAINFYHLQTSLYSYKCSRFAFTIASQLTQLETIAQLAARAYTDGGVVIDFAWYETFNQDGTINYIDPKAHAVVGYGVEAGDYTQLVTEYLAEKGRSCAPNIDFTKRILIYDCANPDGGDRYHLYYSTNGVWCIPGWGIISTQSALADSIWNNGVLQSATADSALLNYIDFQSGERNKNFSFPDTSAYISLTSDSPSYSVSWYNDIVLINGFTVTESTRDEDITVIVSPNITFDGDFTEATTTAFIPLADTYTIKSDDNLNFQLLKDDCLTIVETDAAGSVQIHATGGAAIKMEEAADYNISITDNSGCVNTQWHTIQISGSNATEISASPNSDGIEIIGSNLSDVSIRGESTTDIVDVVFSTNENSALLTESDGVLTVYVDKDKDGVYDTEIVKDVSSISPETTFPDEAFRAYITDNFDIDVDGILSESEIKAVTYIDCGSMGITSLDGIEVFTNLETLYCGCNNLTELDVSNLGSLVELDCWDNNLTELNISGCENLKVLYCQVNELTSLNVSHNTELVHLLCYNNQLTELNLWNNQHLIVTYQEGDEQISDGICSYYREVPMGDGSTGVYTYYLDVDEATMLNIFSWDVNGDSSTNGLDLVAILKHVVGAEDAENSDAIDFNVDGKVDILDVIRLVRYLAGMV